MAKNLIIVESPTKVKTIEKYLGPEYKVMSSYGHIRDLKPKSFSIDVEKGFEPEYEIPEDKAEVVAELRKAAKKADTVWLASDEDREGEAIAWHLAEVLGLDPATTRRIVFHEITKKAILYALDHPRTIDLHRVDAQQARRVLDRIVGFELSPVLWRKVKPALSAGRVQSVVLRLIAEREKEIKEFVSEPFFRVNATFCADGHDFRATLGRRLPSEESARELLSSCRDARFTVGEVTTKPVTKSPQPPFTTSTLQQEAARRLGFTVSQTMMVAQRLYEAGHITYMRTDSLNLSDEAMTGIAAEIRSTMGEEYLHQRRYHTESRGAQEAHEAIRPTDMSVSVPADMGDREKKLYTLIRRRAIASQMADARLEKTTAEILTDANPDARFTASGEVVRFEGFLRAYSDHAETDEDEMESGMLPPLKPGMGVQPREITATERFTQHPPRYSDDSLVKKMEALGIGRPSTYAPTISTLQTREYIEKGEHDGTPRDYRVLTLADGRIAEETRNENAGSDRGQFVPTDVGMVVNEFLTKYFPAIMDYNFTAQIEERFDDIAEGKAPWNGEIKTFYDDFHPRVDETMHLQLEHKVGERLLGQDPEGHPVSVKIGRYGPLVQIGSNEDAEKPRFASLLKGQSMATITLEEALRLFDFPRNLGTFEDKDVTVAIGRFGPYVRHDGKFVSIPKDTEPAAITLDEAVELIRKKRETEANRIVRTFDEDPDLQILNGRYGIYIAYKGKNYKIPKTVADPAALTLEEALEIVRSQADRPARKPRTTRKKS